MVDTTAIREQLENEQETLRSRLRELGAAPEGDGVEIALDENFADSAQTTAERAELLALVHSLRETLDEVNAALGRIESGTYGVCERCGNPIAPARLEALPHARLCMSCQQKRS